MYQFRRAVGGGDGRKGENVKNSGGTRLGMKYSTDAINSLVASLFKVSNVTGGKLEFVREENFTCFS